MKRVELTNSILSRLDAALVDVLKQSRAQIQKSIKAGLVSVDGKPATAHTLVSSASDVTIALPRATTKVAPTPLLPLNILYEDADVIVVNKPAGLLVHKTATSTEPTLVDALVLHDPKIARVGDNSDRPGIVHRLDKLASGVLIVAKTLSAFTKLKQQFAEHTAEKHYTVLVMGRMETDIGTVDFPIARSASKARMAARPRSQEGKPAVTHYTVLNRYANATLLDVRIETGRTHQIRAHMFALSFPVAGDTLYIQKGVKQLKLGRLFLHARSLTIELPNGTTQQFTAPLPNELEQTLASLSKRRP